MTPYKNLSGDSNVQSYSIGPDYIVVKFKTKNKSDFCDTYEYTYTSADPARVDEMKQYAETGAGLNGYINKWVKKKYSRKW